MQIRFLFNPLTLATCLGRSSSSFSNLAVLASIAHATQGILSSSKFKFKEEGLMECVGFVGSAMVELAMASYLSLYPALLLPPLILLCQKRRANVSPRNLHPLFVARGKKAYNVDFNLEIIERFHYCITGIIITELPSRWILGFSRLHVRSHVLLPCPLPALEVWC